MGDVKTLLGSVCAVLVCGLGWSPDQAEFSVRAQSRVYADGRTVFWAEVADVGSYDDFAWYHASGTSIEAACEELLAHVLAEAEYVASPNDLFRDNEPPAFWEMEGRASNRAARNAAGPVYNKVSRELSRKAGRMASKNELRYEMSTYAHLILDGDVVLDEVDWQKVG